MPKMPTVRRGTSDTRSLQTGFTLIELLIIMVILGILAAIVVFAVQNLEGSSSAAACKADFKTVETAQEAYRSEVGQSATSFDQLTNTGVSPTGQVVGPWLKEAPSATHGYQIGFDTTPPTGSVDYGNITVQTFSPAHGPDMGNANCAYA